MSELAFNSVLNEIDSFSYCQCVALMAKLAQTLQGGG